MKFLSFASYIFLSLLCLVIVLSWPKTIRAPQEERHLIDACGNAARIPDDVQNGLLLTPTISEFLFVTGTSDFIISGYDANEFVFNNGIFSHIFHDLRSASTDNHIIDAEELFNINPDIIFDWDFRAPFWRKLGLPAVCVSNKRYEEQSLLDTAQLYANIMNKTYRANKLAYEYKISMDRTINLISSEPHTQGLRLLFLVINSDGRIRVDRSPFINQTVSMIGGKSTKTELSNYSVMSPIDIEEVLRINPDIIILERDSLLDDGIAPEKFMETKIWLSLKAVHEKRVYALPKGVGGYFQGIAENPLLIRWLAEIINQGLPCELREMLKNVFYENFHYSASDKEIDDFLSVSKNHDSYGYERFVAHNSCGN